MTPEEIRLLEKIRRTLEQCRGELADDPMAQPTILAHYVADVDFLLGLLARASLPDAAER